MSPPRVSDNQRADTEWGCSCVKGQESSTQSLTPEAIASDTIVGTEDIGAHSSRAGTVTMLSNNKFSVKHLKFSVGEVLDNGGEHIAKGGIAKLK